MIISGSFWAKAFVTVVAACTFAALFEVTTLDSRYAARPATRHEANALPLPGERVAFSATAYCKGIVTTAGVAVQAGVAAADPEMLPVGSVVEIDSLPPKYIGVYTILDTGPASVTSAPSIIRSNSSSRVGALALTPKSLVAKSS